MSRIRIALAAGALLLGACGSGETETATEAEPVRSPIAEFLGYDLGADFNSEEAQDEWREQEREAEQAIATCMRAEGFEYTPVDYSAFEGYEVFEGEEWGTTEWIEKYGFGISTQRFSQTAVGPDLIGYDDSFNQELEEGGGFQDPNQEYVDSLSETERQAYYDTLHGVYEEPDIDFENMTEEEIAAAEEEFFNQEYEPSGCSAEAYEAIYEDEAFADGGPLDEFDTEFGQELEELWERMQNDPRIVDAEAEVAACVAGEGFPDYTNEEDLYELIEGKLGGIAGGAFMDPFQDLTEEQMAEMTEEDFEAMATEFSEPELSGEDKLKLAEVQDYELGLAKAANKCGSSYFSYDSGKLAEIRAEIEQEWLDQNADRIAKYKGVASS